jgi:hypothetical protein
LNNSDAIIDELRKALDSEQGLADLLEQSLVKARELGEAELNSDLFAALEWPTGIGQYEDYQHMAKGEEFGYFQFGGSDIIVVFQENVDPLIDKSAEFRLVGTPIARCTALGA